MILPGMKSQSFIQRAKKSQNLIHMMKAGRSGMFRLNYGESARYALNIKLIWIAGAEYITIMHYLTQWVNS